jgi:hypothetical protein
MEFKILLIHCLQCAKSDVVKECFDFIGFCLEMEHVNPRKDLKKNEFKFVTEIRLRTEVSQAM